MFVDKENQACLANAAGSAGLAQKCEAIRRGQGQLDTGTVLNTACIDSFEPGPVHVVTMTITGQTDWSGGSENLGIRRIAEFFKENASFKGLAPRQPKPSTRPRKERPAFQNAVTLSYAAPGSGDHNYCVKAFANSRVHVCGSRTIDEFLQVSRATCEMLTALAGRPVTLLDLDVNLINMQFYVGHRLHVTEVCELLRESDDPRVQAVSYDPDRFPGVIAKFRLTSADKAERERVVSLMAFGNSNVKICGLRSPEEGVEPHAFLLRLLEDNWARVADTAPAPASRKRKREAAAPLVKSEPVQVDSAWLREAVMPTAPATLTMADLVPGLSPLRAPGRLTPGKSPLARSRVLGFR